MVRSTPALRVLGLSHGRVSRGNRTLRRVVVACATALIWILHQEQSHASLHGHGLITATLLNPVFLRFLLFFAAGAVLSVNTDKVPTDGLYSAVAASVAAVTLLGGSFFILGFVGFAYLVIWAAARLPFHRVGVGSAFRALASYEQPA
jgi:hypothetical protein